MPECDSHPASHVAVAITLNAKASSLKTSLSATYDGDMTHRKQQK